MAISINLRHLEKKELQLNGTLPVAELDLEGVDELVRFPSDLTYELSVEKLQESVLVQGKLKLDLDCDCARCLKPFRTSIDIEDWACHIPLEGEEAANVVSDSVDLTPYIREDILLRFPQRPLCQNDCNGLASSAAAEGNNRDESSPPANSSAWSELNKLKF